MSRQSVFHRPARVGSSAANASSGRYTVRMRRESLTHAGALASAIRRRLTHGRPPSHALVTQFILCRDEQRFARAVLVRGTRYWLFRSNQRRFCGDFAIIDMSEPRPGRRPCWVVELKLGADLRVGGGGAGIQLRHAHRAIAHVAATSGVVPLDATPELVAGDRRAILAHLGIA